MSIGATHDPPVVLLAAGGTGGTVGYPPKPTTADGATRPSRRRACSVPNPSSAAVRANDTGSRPRTVALVTM